MGKMIYCALFSSTLTDLCNSLVVCINVVLEVDLNNCYSLLLT